MAKIILNPDAPAGAPIKKFTITDKGSFFTDDVFEPGTLFQFEDEEVADIFLKHFGFLYEMSQVDAKKWLAQEKMSCEKCSFKTRNQTELDKHMKAHDAEKELSDLGIPVLKKQIGGQRIVTIDDMQKQIDAQDKADGLDGDGLVNDHPQHNVTMS